ncbi:hypothetical protein RhiirC2_789646 [Rhizophagus irregularis]|uniref:Uncharacterized protein n=1 Tax=Rhizophagus irregularis TaxID=588596 RepID=A0A2N1MMT6_9GLOM|nr:hypothetical protein RhiirC2_789646 [Rhizophagus irregularis]
MKDLPKNITTSMLYPSNPIQSPLSHLECKTFKVVQKKSTCKLIMYYKNWVDLEKIMNTKLNLQEYESVWTRYFSPQLSKSRNRSLKSDRNQKQNQDLADKVGLKTTNNKNQKSKPTRKELKNYRKLKKSLDGDETGKLTLLVEIRSLLRRLEY